MDVLLCRFTCNLLRLTQCMLYPVPFRDHHRYHRHQVVATFFATYALVILPFEKRRGPFVTGGVFAHAADTTPILDMQQQQQQLQDDVAAAAASSRSGLAALDLEAQRKVMVRMACCVGCFCDPTKKLRCGDTRIIVVAMFLSE